MPWWRFSLLKTINKTRGIARKRRANPSNIFFIIIRQQQQQQLLLSLQFSSSPILNNNNHNNTQNISPKTPSKFLILTPQIVLTTLQKNPSDFLSLTFFLWCARQPRYFHDRYVFDYMPNVLKRLIQQSSVKGLLERLQKEANLVIKPQTLLLLLRIFWHGGMYDFVFQLFDEMPNYDYTPNTYAHNILVDILFKIQRLDLALQVFRDIDCPNFLTFSIGICNLCKLLPSSDRFLVTTIRDVLRRMLRKGYYLNSEAFLFVVHSFCKCGEMKNSLELVGLMVSLGNPISVNIWSILIDGFCKRDSVAMANCLFDKMLDCGCSPNVVTYTSLIKGLLKSQMPDKALRILGTMESKGCVPDLVLCNTLIHSLSKLGRYDDALDIYFSLLPKWNLVPDSYTFCSIIVAVCSSQQFDLLPLLISGICIEVDLVTANSLLSYFCKAGYPSGAVDLYNDMINRGFVPDGYSYAGLLTGLFGMGRVDEAVHMYNAIVENGFCVDAHIHTIVVQGLVSLGKLHRVIRFFSNAAQHKYSLDVVSYTVAIKGLVQGGAIQKACDLFIQMKEDGVAPNAYTYNLMLSGFSRSRDIKMVREILNEMIDEGIVLNDNMVKILLSRSKSSLNLFNEMCSIESIALVNALGALLIKGGRIDCCVDRGRNLVTVQNVYSNEMSDVAVAVG